ncbi:MAG: aldehyde dehydrogenase family protein, partial [Chloroflexota bacterium]
VVTGGLDLAQAFSGMPWNHLLFTGGPEIGKKVMAAAAKHLTPVTLELGGKNPTIIAEDSLDEKTIEAIIATKMVKSGQMCITSDYVFVPEGKVERFVKLAQRAMAKLYPKVIDNRDSTSVINEGHYARLESYLADARDSGTQMVELNPAGETADASKRKLVPTLVIDPDEDRLVMRHEIFGPILPVKTYRTIDEAIEYINDRERPLALYIFSKESRTIDKILNNTISGGVAVNAVALQTMQASLPFGGTGNSGMGHHHGYEGFVGFSKAKPVFYQAPINGSNLLYPPYGKNVTRLLDFLLR